GISGASWPPSSRKWRPRPTAPRPSERPRFRTVYSCAVLPWIEKVTQRVAHEVEREHGDEDCEAGEGRGPPGGAQHGAAVLDHEPPVGYGRLRTEAQERQARSGEDDGADVERGLNQDGRNRV